MKTAEKRYAARIFLKYAGAALVSGVVFTLFWMLVCEQVSALNTPAVSAAVAAAGILCAVALGTVFARRDMDAIRDLDEEDTGRIRRKMREMKRVLKTGAVSQELYDRKMSGI